MTSHTTALAASLGLVLGFGAAVAGGAVAPNPTELRAQQTETEVVSGVIREVKAESNEFVLEVSNPGTLEDDQKMTIRVNDVTRYTLDGKDSSMSEALQVDRKATVTHKDGLASLVEVRTEQP